MREILLEMYEKLWEADKDKVCLECHFKRNT